MGKQERRRHGDVLKETQTARLQEKGFEGDIPPLAHDEWNSIRKTLDNHDYLNVTPDVTVSRIKKDIPAAAKRTERETTRRALMENMKSGIYGESGRAMASAVSALSDAINIGLRKKKRMEEAAQYRKDAVSDIKPHPQWEGYNKKRRLDKLGRDPHY